MEREDAMAKSYMDYEHGSYWWVKRVLGGYDYETLQPLDPQWEPARVDQKHYVDHGGWMVTGHEVPLTDDQIAAVGEQLA
jgi:hypothetical protein